MRINASIRIRTTLLVLLTVTLTVLSTRLQADTATCGGQSTTTLPFTDGPSSNIFFCSIAEAYFAALTNGTTSTTYSPSANVTREQMAAFVTRTMDESIKRNNKRAAMKKWYLPQIDTAYGFTNIESAALDLKFDGADLWTANSLGTVSRVRASDGQVLGTWTGATGANSILIARGRVFVVGNTSPGMLYVIDPTQPPGPVTTLLDNLDD